MLTGFFSRQSIQSRLSFGLLLSLCGVFVILWLIVSYSIQQLAESYTASRLQHDIETLLSAIHFDPQNKLLLNQKRINPIYNRPFSGHYYHIQYQNKSFRSRSLWDQTLRSANISNQHYTRAKQTGPERQPLLIVSRQFHKQGQVFTISVAEDLSLVNTNIRYFKTVFALVSVISLIFLLILQMLILRGGLRPLKQIKTELRLLEQGEISKLTTSVPSELQPLVLEINYLLSILQQRLHRSRNALSDLSHALKKPLSVLQQLVNQKHTDETNWQQQSNIQIETITHLIDRILKRARLSGNAQSIRLFDFKNDLDLLIKTIRMMYPDKHIQIKKNLSEQVCPHFDREDMLELFGNIIENAYKWATSQILIQIDKTRGWEIVIEDDGSGCDIMALKPFPQRGMRLDNQVQGHGFGLAIVTDIVNDYQGKIIFSQSEKLGGFKVLVRLPDN